MARTLHRLTDAVVRKAKPKAGKARMIADGGGLYLQISAGPDGAIHKSWIFRYAFSRTEDGRPRERQMGLGPVHTVSLAQARENAREARELRLKDADPIDYRRRVRASQRQAKAKSMTFAEAARKYLKQFEDGWKSARHAQQWHSTLRDFVLPKLGGLDVTEIDTDAVLGVLLPIWSEIPETASRIRGRIEKVMDYAGHNGNNPARWRGYLEHRLARRNRVRDVEHFAALDWRQVPAFMALLQEPMDIPAQALKFTALTAARSGEVLGATWDEIDFEDRCWVIPKKRMKRDREHRVPLSDDAMAVIARMADIRHEERIFPMGLNAMRRRLNELWPGITTHGFRSTFRDWASEDTTFPDRVVEAALAHAIGNAVEAAYRRGDLFERRRHLMGQWAQYCDQRASGNVCMLRGETSAA